MLEAILDLSGAGMAMDEMMSRIEPEMQFMEEVQYPLVQQLSRQDISWLKLVKVFTNLAIFYFRARQTFSPDQMTDYKKHGFVHLTEEQINLVYGGDRFNSKKSH